MPGKAKFTTDEVACYLTERLRHGGKRFRQGGMRGWIREQSRAGFTEAAKNAELDPFRKERILGEVIALARNL